MTGDSARASSLCVFKLLHIDPKKKTNHLSTKSTDTNPAALQSSVADPDPVASGLFWSPGLVSLTLRPESCSHFVMASKDFFMSMIRDSMHEFHLMI